MPSAAEVFTPSAPAKLSFIERERVNNKLVNALQTPGKQIVIYGHSGAGKTTLLQNKLFQTYENHITTRCIKGMTFDQVVIDAFDQLEPFYLSEKSLQTAKERKKGIEGTYQTIKLSLEQSLTSTISEKNQRTLPPQLTPQNLARLVGSAKACWVLEDFHKLDAVEKTRLAQTMKVFMDMAQDFPDLKTVALGAVNTARDVVQYDKEMLVRVTEVEVPLMEDSELQAIIDKGQQLLNIQISKGIGKQIVKYSNGLAAVCHQLCLNICHVSGIQQTQPLRKAVTRENFDEAIRLYLDGTSDTLKNKLDRAIKTERKRKFDNCRLILQSLVQVDQEGATIYDLHKIIREKHGDYPSGNLTGYLKLLCGDQRGEVLRLDSASGKYSYSDAFLRAYASIFFSKENNDISQRAAASSDELMKLLLRVLDDQGSSLKMIKKSP